MKDVIGDILKPFPYSAPYHTSYFKLYSTNDIVYSAKQYFTCPYTCSSKHDITRCWFDCPLFRKASKGLIVA